MATDPSEEPGSGATLSRSDLQRSAIQGASWTMVHTIVSVPLAFGVNIVIARVLGKIDYGRLAFLSSLMEIVGGIVAMGVGIGLVQFGAKAHAAGRIAEVQRLLSKAQGFRLLIDVPVLTVLILAIVRVDPALLVIALLFGVLAPAALNGAPSCLTIENKTAAGAQNAMIVNAITQAAVLVVVLTIGTADAVWSVRLVAVGLGVALSLFWVSPVYRRAVLRPSLPRGFPQGFWAFSIPAGLAGVLGAMVVSRTEVLALTWLGQPAAAGTFALAFGVANHIFAPAQALIGPLVPAISGLRAVDEDSVRPAFIRTVRGTATVVALLVAAAVPAFAALIPLIYGSEFGDASGVFVVLALGGALLVLAGPVSAFVQARLSGWTLLLTNLAALGVDVVLMLTLIPPFGVWGAVAANLTAALVRLGLLLRVELRGLDVRWSDLGRGGLPILLGTVACLASWTTVGWLALAPGWAALAAGALGLGLLLGLLAVARSGLAPEDADAILRSFPAPLSTMLAPLMRALTHARAQ